MKTILRSIIPAAVLASVPAFATGTPDAYRPIGNIDVVNTLVAAGSRAQISWEIIYPAAAPDLVISHPSGKIVTNEELRVTMRVAGVAFQSGSTPLDVAFSARVNSQPWQQLFHGNMNEVDPTALLFDQVVPAGTELNFGGQGRRSGGNWYDAHYTGGSDSAVTGLFDGDTPPSYAPAYEQGSIESFLSAYISSDNTVEIGPRDMIYLFELANGNPGDWWYDMQDLVVIINFEQTTSQGFQGQR